MTLANRIRSTFTAQTIDAAPRVVQGITVRDLKIQLRGVVYQSQPKFCEQIKAVGFQMSWSHQTNGYVVHE